MEKMIDIIEKMESVSGAIVDQHFLQGNEAVLKQLNLRHGNYNEQFVASSVEDARARITDMIRGTHPHIIPEEYIFFLEYCGGLSIDDEDYYFSTYGIGPLVEEYYSSIDSDFAMPEFHWGSGLLKVGHINFRRGKLKDHDVYFLLDLANNVQKHCVFGIGPCGWESTSPATITEDLQHYTDEWQIVANSFTEWLELAVKTRGSFGYLA